MDTIDVLSPELLIVIVALISALAGAVLMWIIGSLIGGNKDQRHDRPRPVQAQAEDAASPGERELLRVSRAAKEGLGVFVQGRRYRHLQQITDPQVGSETIEALKAVLAFADGWLPALRQQEAPQPAPKRTAVDEEAFLAQLRQADLFPGEKASGLSFRPRRHASHAAPGLLVTPAEAINELVQERLQERPDLAGHSISLTTARDGGLCIHVGLQSFDAVDSIPDPEVRGLIQDAIHEWGEA